MSLLTVSVEQPGTVYGPCLIAWLGRFASTAFSRNRPNTTSNEKSTEIHQMILMHNGCFEQNCCLIQHNFITWPLRKGIIFAWLSDQRQAKTWMWWVDRQFLWALLLSRCPLPAVQMFCRTEHVQTNLSFRRIQTAVASFLRAPWFSKVRGILRSAECLQRASLWLFFHPASSLTAFDTAAMSKCAKASKGKTWSGERSAELVSTTETRNPKPTLKT